MPECELGGDERDCSSCAYGGEFKFNKKTGRCERIEVRI